MDRKTALLLSLDALKDKKEALLRDLSAVDAELEATQAQFSRLLNEDTFIYRLPDELISGIFLACQQMARLSRKANIPLQVVASHVSHRWREIILSTPLLWNTVDLRIRPTNHIRGRVLSQLDAHLTRSLDTCLLNITLDISIPDDISEYLKLLVDHSDRWRRLSILARYEKVGDIQAVLSYAQAPALEHLSLNIGKPGFLEGSPRRPYQNVYPNILPSSGTTLTFVRLAGLALGHSHPPTHSVTTLHLDGWTRHFMTHEQLKAVLEAAIALENLSLNQLYIRPPRDPLEILQPVNLPNLGRLRVRGFYWPVSLSLMEMPGLHSLSLHDVETFDLRVLPSVQSLSLEACAFSDAELRSLFQATPSITTLSIDDSIPEIYSMMLPGAALSKPWPHLETISLRNLQSRDVGHFCNMVFNVGESHKNLARVYLDRRSRTVLRTKHRLDWLQDRLKVENFDIPEAWPPGLGYEDTHDLLD
ncbi:hypothetical protein CPB84DRAFT_1680867 [Gymnopilus junonius]|uniref:F-box domain-containing protein n=1 Tax=Gymnopilus junonius TaxID=109634 RepID=A0A9P5TLW8_GYMJU|nr:hypothetical protein CPB84DRAFT_1680867 [Gymnopilus junonius]